MLLIGLTGSIATGKSTVSAILSQPPYSLPIIDADLLARQVVEPGTPGYAKIVSHFGSTTPDLLLPKSSDTDFPAGQPLNRPALGRRVFGNSEERRRDRAVLNGIVHPAVRKAMASAILKAYFQGHWAVILDVPLLFESGLDVFCGTVLVVGVTDPDIQLKRLLDRDQQQGGSMTKQEARDRVSSQGDVRVKAKRAESRAGTLGLVIWNDGGKEDLQKGIRNVMARLQDSSPKWWSFLLLGVPPLAFVMAALSYVRAWLAKRDWDNSQLQEKAKL